MKILIQFFTNIKKKFSKSYILNNTYTLHINTYSIYSRILKKYKIFRSYSYVSDVGVSYRYNLFHDESIIILMEVF